MLGAVLQETDSGEVDAGRGAEGYVYTLPTEAQWEYACRAGTQGAFSGKVEDLLGVYELYQYTCEPVGMKKPNPWGFYDMHRNVYEWCLDAYYDYPSRDTVDPCYVDGVWEFIVRGGGA